MKLNFWGTRGSLASPGADTVRYGGNTAAVELRIVDESVIVLDAGTGIRALGAGLDPAVTRVDILLSHLHMDHIQGLGFFGPLYDPALEVHIWGPASSTLDLGARLGRYLSPPLFPVGMRELPCRLELHDLPIDTFEVPGATVRCALVGHPGPTVGYRIAGGDRVVTYLPDHEPALGVISFPDAPQWTSGFALAQSADVLIHDAHYTDAEYQDHVGWGHSSWSHATTFAAHVGAKHLVAFHHDPDRSDDEVDALLGTAQAALAPSIPVTAAAEGATLDLS